MDWKGQAWAFTALGLVGAAGLFLLLMVMRWLPGPPGDAHLPTPMTWDLALNTAVSFPTGTTWQAYSGGNTLPHWAQLMGLATQGFLAGGSGSALAMAFIRGFGRPHPGPGQPGRFSRRGDAGSCPWRRSWRWSWWARGR